MSKNTIKKIILTIVIISVLILSLVFFFNISSQNYSEDISVVKKIINERYDDVVYFDNSNYLYAYNKDYTYTVFDYNGNKLYDLNFNKKIDLVYVSKKYYIVKENEYHLYDNDSNEIVKGNNIYGLNEYLIFSDNNIINTKGEVLFYNVNSIKSYYNNKYFSVDNYFINEKGKVLLVDYKIIKEKEIENDIDYFIIKKENKYYCFFPLVNKIIGDGFDKYFEYNDEVYIVSDNKIYLIYKNGLRKEIKFVIDKNIYSIDYSNAVKKNKVLAIRDYYLGLLETDTNKFHKIVKTKKFTFKYIDDNHISINCNNINYVYDINNYKIVYKNTFDNIVIFDNNYKTIKESNTYYLLDDKDRRITSSNKQIILLNSKVKIGKVNKKIVLFDNDLYPGVKISINDKKYYKYEINNYKYIISSDLKNEYKSNLYLNYMNDTIVKMDKNKIYFYNIKNNKTYSYNLSNYRIKNKDINKNEIILSNNKDILILNKKGKVIKKIRNVQLESMFYNNVKKEIVLVVKKRNMNKAFKGAYVLK